MPGLPARHTQRPQPGPGPEQQLPTRTRQTTPAPTWAACTRSCPLRCSRSPPGTAARLLVSKGNQDGEMAGSAGLSSRGRRCARSGVGSCSDPRPAVAPLLASAQPAHREQRRHGSTPTRGSSRLAATRESQPHLRHLRGLARPGLPNHHQHLQPIWNVTNIFAERLATLLRAGSHQAVTAGTARQHAASKMACRGSVPRFCTTHGTRSRPAPSGCIHPRQGCSPGCRAPPGSAGPAACRWAATRAGP